MKIELRESNKTKGFIKTIIIILVALALLKIVFNFNIFNFFKLPIIKDALDYIWKIIETVWNGGLSRIFFFVWDNGQQAVILGWHNLLIILDKIQNIVTGLTRAR